jgi:hypothetical protein
MNNLDQVRRVEQACHHLQNGGRPITFADVAAHAQIGRTTLYRRPELRAVIEEHRQREHQAFTLTGLTVQLDQLRATLEALAAKVRRHEEQLRRLH